MDKMFPNVLIVNGKHYVMYGDSGYNTKQFMEVPFQGWDLNAALLAFNLSMSRVRVTVEWALKEVKLYCTTVDYKLKIRIGESPFGAL